ncbi:MAG: SurA N-terminal domain-containing protein [Pseudomonadota bacterium]
MIPGFKKMLVIACTGYILTFTITGCLADKPDAKDKIIATINGHSLTLDEYESKLAREMDYTLQYKTSAEARSKFLDTLIQKELLIQEATHLGLERTRTFMNAIEKYWEATLIKNLMEEKIKEISQKTTVTDKEIQDYYTGLQASKEALLPLDQIEPDIAGQLKNEKQTQMLEQWINELKNKATIQINKQFL